MVGIIQPFSGERCTYENFVLLFIYFLFCFLYYIFDTYITQILLSNKTWLSELFSLLSRQKVLLLQEFLFYFNLFKFIYDCHCHQYYCDYFHYCCCCHYFCHCYCHYYFFMCNAFNFCYSSFCHSTL